MTTVRKQQERAQAIILLAQLPEGSRDLLVKTFAAFKAENATAANQLVEKRKPDASVLLRVLTRQRDPLLSAGKLGDAMNLAVWTNTLKERGYCSTACSIVAYVHHHYLESALAEYASKLEQSSAPAKMEPPSQAPALSHQPPSTSEMIELPEWLEEKATNAPDDGPTGVAGWLALLCFLLIVASPLNWVGAAARLYSVNGVSIPMFALVGLAGFSLYAGLALYQLKPGAVTLAKGYLVTTFAIVLGLSHLATSVGAEAMASANAPITEAALQALATGAFVLVWIVYLTKSKRVRTTYASEAFSSPSLGARGADPASPEATVAESVALPASERQDIGGARSSGSATNRTKTRRLGSSLSEAGTSSAEPAQDIVPLPEWLKEKATSAPTMVRVLVDIVAVRLRRTYPRIHACPEWHRFREVGTIAGCVALALRLHVDVPQRYRTSLEMAMRESLEMGFPESGPLYGDCVQSVGEALLEVERPKRAAAAFVLASMWVFGMVDSEGALASDPELVAELAQLYQIESSTYWRPGEHG